MPTVQRNEGGGLVDQALGAFFDGLTTVMHSAAVENERAWRGTVAIEAGRNGLGIGDDRAPSFDALCETGDLYWQDTTVDEMPMNEARGLERNQEVRASLEPSKQEARFSPGYGAEHYQEAAPHIQPDTAAHQAWMRREGSSQIDDLRQERVDAMRQAGNLGVDTSAGTVQPMPRASTRTDLGEGKVEALRQEEVARKLNMASLGLSSAEDYEPMQPATFADLYGKDATPRGPEITSFDDLCGRDVGAPEIDGRDLER